MANMLINLLNFIISAFGSLVVSILNLLPSSPFSAISNSGAGEWLSGFAWICPLGQMLAITEAWLTCIIAYYAYSVALRWAKVVS